MTTGEVFLAFDSDLQLSINNITIDVGSDNNNLIFKLSNPTHLPGLISHLPSIEYSISLLDKLIQVIQLYKINILFNVGGVTVFSLKHTQQGLSPAKLVNKLTALMNDQ